jgi:hypothetical protein
VNLADAPTTWRNRIVGHAEVAPSKLVPNPRNWRSHPPEQQRALAGALAEVGWVAEVLVNRTTGNVVDGHLRIELALARNEPTVPVTYVELTDDEERLILASLDPLTAMASAEREQLAELLDGLEPADGALRALLDDLARQYELDALRAGLADPDEVPALPDEPTVRRGDMYQLGDHRLLSTLRHGCMDRYRRRHDRAEWSTSVTARARHVTSRKRRPTHSHACDTMTSS